METSTRNGLSSEAKQRAGLRAEQAELQESEEEAAAQTPLPSPV